MRAWRDKPLAVTDLRTRAFRQTQHQPHARAIDVGIQHPDFGPFTGQRQRQVGCGRGFANPALARGNGNNVLHLLQCRHLPLHVTGLNLATHADLCRSHTIYILDRHLHHLGDATDQAASGIAQHQFGLDAPAVDIQPAQTAGTEQVGTKVRILILSKGLLNGGTIKRSHGDIP